MKNIIEQTIKKNLPQSIKLKEGGSYYMGFKDCVDNINTSLIADEVLKVVVEKLEKVFDKHCNYSPKKIESEEEYGYNKGLMAEAKLLKFEILQLLSEHLSPNKENKNNG